MSLLQFFNPRLRCCFAGSCTYAICEQSSKKEKSNNLRNLGGFGCFSSLFYGTVLAQRLALVISARDGVHFILIISPHVQTVLVLLERRSTIVDHVGWLPLVPDNELYRVSRVESPLVMALAAKVVSGGPHAERANAKEGRADQVLGRLDYIVEKCYSYFK